MDCICDSLFLHLCARAPLSSRRLRPIVFPRCCICIVRGLSLSCAYGLCSESKSHTLIILVRRPLSCVAAQHRSCAGYFFFIYRTPPCRLCLSTPQCAHADRGSRFFVWGREAVCERRYS